MEERNHCENSSAEEVMTSPQSRVWLRRSRFGGNLPHWTGWILWLIHIPGSISPLIDLRAKMRCMLGGVGGIQSLQVFLGQVQPCLDPLNHDRRCSLTSISACVLWPCYFAVQNPITGDMATGLEENDRLMGEAQNLTE